MESFNIKTSQMQLKNSWDLANKKTKQKHTMLFGHIPLHVIWIM